MSINICFHGVGTCVVEREPGEAMYWMAEGTFLRTLDAAMGVPNVELSFDDGNRSDVDVALPALLERGLTASFFPIAGRLEDPASLNAEDLKSLISNGMSIGSHGWGHVPWQRLDAPTARREFVESKSALSTASGAAVGSAACPLGRYDAATLRGLKAAGYTTVYTSDRFPAREGAWIRARYSVTSTDSVESIARIMHHRFDLGDAVKQGKSLVKRLR